MQLSQDSVQSFNTQTYKLQTNTPSTCSDMLRESSLQQHTFQPSRVVWGKDPGSDGGAELSWLSSSAWRCGRLGLVFVRYDIKLNICGILNRGGCGSRGRPPSVRSAVRSLTPQVSVAKCPWARYWASNSPCWMNVCVRRAKMCRNHCVNVYKSAL